LPKTTGFRDNTLDPYGNMFQAPPSDILRTTSYLSVPLAFLVTYLLRKNRTVYNPLTKLAIIIYSTQLSIAKEVNKVNALGAIDR